MLRKLEKKKLKKMMMPTFSSQLIMINPLSFILTMKATDLFICGGMTTVETKSAKV